MTITAGGRPLRRSSMTRDAAIMKRAFGPDFIKVAIPGIPGIAFASMTRAALPQLRNSPRAHRVMASGASRSRFSFESGIGFRIDSRFVRLVVEPHDASGAAYVEPEEFRLSLLALVMG